MLKESYKYLASMGNVEANRLAEEVIGCRQEIARLEAENKDLAIMVDGAQRVACEAMERSRKLGS
jgi:hypothetical protein